MYKRKSYCFHTASACVLLLFSAAAILFTYLLPLIQSLLWLLPHLLHQSLLVSACLLLDQPLTWCLCIIPCCFSCSCPLNETVGPLPYQLLLLQHGLQAQVPQLSLILATIVGQAIISGHWDCWFHDPVISLADSKDDMPNYSSGWIIRGSSISDTSKYCKSNNNLLPAH